MKEDSQEVKKKNEIKEVESYIHSLKNILFVQLSVNDKILSNVSIKIKPNQDK
mgnify:CR=1 FL=1